MKKFIYSLLALMAFTLGALTLTACGDDDDDVANVPSWLVGSWQECDSKGNVYNDATGYEVLHATYNANGTGRWWAVSNGKTTDWYEFKFSGSGNGTTANGTITITSSSNNSIYPVGASESGTISISDNGIMNAGDIYYKKVN